MTDRLERLAAWLATKIDGAQDVRIEDVDRAAMGHSAETLVMTISWEATAGAQVLDVVVRVRPPAPGLLEPYDLARQFLVLRALEPTAVKAPRALWLEPTGDVLGREFYVMERLRGQVYERGYPEELAADPDRLRRMCTGIAEQIAAVHTVPLSGTGLESLGDGRDYLTTELVHWNGEIERMRRGAVPALDQLAAALRERQPEQCATVALVHGDTKPGNFAFEESEVTAVFDWEMTSVGDPLADVGWAEVNWTMPGYFTAARGALTCDEFVALWQDLTGIAARHRPWYRALQLFKMAAICFVGGQLVDRGHSRDIRLVDMAYAVSPLTVRALGELGIEDVADHGTVLPRKERIAGIKEAHEDE